MKLVKERKYLETVSTYNTNTLQEFIDYLQERKNIYQEQYPDAVFEIDPSDFESSDLIIEAVIYFKDTNEWAAYEEAKKQERERQQDEKDRKLYEQLHARFNRS